MDVRSLRGRKVTIVEVGPRDGLQNERVSVSTADKIEDSSTRTRLGEPAGHRGLGLRQPEVGAPDGRRRRRLRRHHAGPGHALHRARAESRGAHARDARRGVRDRGIRRGDGNVQSHEHQSEHRRLARRLQAGVRPRARCRRARARVSVRRLRLPVRGRRPAGEGRGHGVQTRSRSACSRWPSATR